RCDQRLHGEQKVETASPLGCERIHRHCFSGSPQVDKMKPADAVCGKEPEKLGIRVRVGWWNVELVKTGTVEAAAGPSGHDPLAKRSQRADDRCGGIDSDVICDYEPGGGLDFAGDG